MSANLRKMSYFEGFFLSLMVGWGETYLPAFGFAQGMSDVQLGLLATLPLIAGATLQLVTPRAIHHRWTHKEWIIGAGVVQSLLFALLGGGALSGQFNFLTLFVLSSLYWGGTQATSSAWNFWMGNLISAEQSAEFFAKRLRFMQLGILVGIVTGGLTLEWARKNIGVEYAFAALFFFASLSRIISVSILWRQPYIEKWLEFRRQPRFRVRDTFKKMLEGQGQRKFFTFLFLFNTAVYISAPFVTPFMLSQMKLNYDRYMLALAALLIPKVLFMPFTHRMIEKIGVRRTFVYSAIALSPMPAVWVWISGMPAVIILQALSGMAWAGFEVSLLVIFFKNLKLEEKTQVLTLYNLFNATSVIAGGLIGAKLLKIFEPNLVGYGIVFMSAAGLRLLCLWPFLRHFHGMPKAAPIVLESWGIHEMGVATTVANPGPTVTPKV